MRSDQATCWLGVLFAGTCLPLSEPRSKAGHRANLLSEQRRLAKEPGLGTKIPFLGFQGLTVQVFLVMRLGMQAQGRGSHVPPPSPTPVPPPVLLALCLCYWLPIPGFLQVMCGLSMCSGFIDVHTAAQASRKYLPKRLLPILCSCLLCRRSMDHMCLSLLLGSLLCSIGLTACFGTSATQS